MINLFKVGDRLKFKEEFLHQDDLMLDEGPEIVEEMYKFRNRGNFTVSIIEDDPTCILIKEDEGRWNWDPRWFDLLDEDGLPDAPIPYD